MWAGLPCLPRWSGWSRPGFRRMGSRHGTQSGDPKKVAKALIHLSQVPDPPLRIPLGEDSIDRLEKKNSAQAAEFAKWRALTLSIAFDEGEG
jgi:hypothetical protein